MMTYEIETWEPPTGKFVRDESGRCAGVGVRLYHHHYDDDSRSDEFKFRWFNQDPLIWEIPIIERREWFNEFMRDFTGYIRYATFDSTPEFNRNIDSLKKRGGLLIGVGGRKGSGKSWAAQMLINKIVDTIPIVLFQYKDIERHVRPTTDIDIGVLIDEDLRATGNDSRNIVVHIANMWDTNRKARLFGVCTGVNLNFESWGDTLDMRVRPCGINKRLQATRLAMFDKNNRFLGFAVIQRRHKYDDRVYYYDELGIWGEYQSRAQEFSRNVTRQGGAIDAIDSQTQDEHIRRFIDYLTELREQGKEIPDNETMLRRLYRKAGLPAKSVGYMKEIILWALDEIELGDTQRDYTGQTSDFRDAILDHLMTIGIDRNMIECYRLNRRGFKQDYIATELGLSQATVSRYLNSFSTVVGKTELGYAFESVYAKYLHDNNIPYRASGGNTDEPDILIVDDDGTVIEIHSLKCHNNERASFTIPFSELSGKEIQLAQTENIPLELVAYDIYHALLFKRSIDINSQVSQTFNVSDRTAQHI